MEFDKCKINIPFINNIFWMVNFQRYAVQDWSGEQGDSKFSSPLNFQRGDIIAAFEIDGILRFSFQFRNFGVSFCIQFPTWLSRRYAIIVVYYKFYFRCHARIFAWCPPCRWIRRTSYPWWAVSPRCSWRGATKFISIFFTKFRLFLITMFFTVQVAGVQNYNNEFLWWAEVSDDEKQYLRNFSISQCQMWQSHSNRHECNRKIHGAR